MDETPEPAKLPDELLKKPEKAKPRTVGDLQVGQPGCWMSRDGLGVDSKGRLWINPSTPIPNEPRTSQFGIIVDKRPEGYVVTFSGPMDTFEKAEEGFSYKAAGFVPVVKTLRA